MTSNSFKSVWDAIEDDPSAVVVMKMRTSLMIELCEYIDERGLTTTEASRFFGVNPTCIANLTGGKIQLFSLEELLGMAVTAGMSPVLTLLNERVSRV